MLRWVLSTKTVNGQGVGKMKITRKQIREILKEQYDAPTFTEEERSVIDAMAILEKHLENMGGRNPDLTDYYVSLFRAMKKHAGIDPAGLARLV